MSSGTRVKPAPVRALPLRPALQQRRRERTLRGDLRAAPSRPGTVQAVDLSRGLPPIPADSDSPRSGIPGALRGGWHGWLQRADQVITVRTMQVTHMPHLTSLVTWLRVAALKLVTSNFPQEIKGVTSVTRDSSDSLRARTRRASDESHVTHVPSNLTSDVVTSNLTYQLHCGRTHPRSDSSKIMSLTSLE